MSFLKAPPQQPKNETVQLRLSQIVKFRLARYAEFIHASPPTSLRRCSNAYSAKTPSSKRISRPTNQRRQKTNKKEMDRNRRFSLPRSASHSQTSSRFIT